MKYPNFNEEKKLWKRGYKFVIGLDEAGRGPLAGPVVAAAVTINPKHEIRWTPAGGLPAGLHPKQIRIFKIQNSKHVSNFDIRILNLNVRDSKQLSEKQREIIYKELVNCCDVVWGIGIVSEKIIDKINILEATKLAMKRAINNLKKNFSCHISRYRLFSDAGSFLLIDGNFNLDLNEAAFAKGIGAPKQKSVIKGDQKVVSIAAASIIAKVTRDKLMQKYHKRYPQYGFDRHKGYPTKAHFAKLQKFGSCEIHRKTFRPVKCLD